MSLKNAAYIKQNVINIVTEIKQDKDLSFIKEFNKSLKSSNPIYTNNPAVIE